MEQKNLAEEYTHKAFLKRNRSNCMSIHDLCFSVTDIKAAFNAGRESVVENGYNKKEGYRGANSLLGGAYYLHISDTFNPKGESLWGFSFGGERLVQWYDTKQEAEQAANEDYKKRIKQALKL